VKRHPEITNGRGLKSLLFGKLLKALGRRYPHLLSNIVNVKRSLSQLLPATIDPDWNAVARRIGLCKPYQLSVLNRPGSMSRHTEMRDDIRTLYLVLANRCMNSLSFCLGSVLGGTPRWAVIAHLEVLFPQSHPHLPIYSPASHTAPYCRHREGATLDGWRFAYGNVGEVQPPVRRLRSIGW
jgi:hypothetical protein